LVKHPYRLNFCTLSLHDALPICIWRAHALKPHRVLTFKFTTDPEAEDKIYDVVGLYLNPPTHAVVLSLDEKTQIQALSRTQPLRSEEHTSELQSLRHLVCRLLLE